MSRKITQILFLNNYQGSGIGDFGQILRSHITSRLGPPIVEETSIDGVRIFYQLARLVAHRGTVLANVGLTSWGSSPARNFLGFVTLGLRAALRRPTVVLLHNVIEVITPNDSGYQVSPLIRTGSHIAVSMLKFATIIVFSHCVAKTLTTLYGITPVIVTPIPCELEPTVRAERPNARSKCAVYIGYLAPYKGLELLVETWKILREKLALTVIGAPHRVLALDERFEAWLDKILSNLRLVGGNLTGRLPEPELSDHLANSTIGVLPYSSTSGGSAAFARMAGAGLPVIATDLPEFRWLKSLGAGIEISLGSPCKFSASVLKVIDNEDYIRELRERQLKFAEKYNWEEFTQMLHRLIT